MQRLSYCLMKKIQNFSYKDWPLFLLSSKKTYLVYLTSTNFTQRNRKIYDANDLALSLVSIMSIFVIREKHFVINIWK